MRAIPSTILKSTFFKTSTFLSPLEICSTIPSITFLTIFIFSSASASSSTIDNGYIGSFDFWSFTNNAKSINLWILSGLLTGISIRSILSWVLRANSFSLIAIALEAFSVTNELIRQEIKIKIIVPFTTFWSNKWISNPTLIIAIVAAAWETLKPNIIFLSYFEYL